MMKTTNLPHDVAEMINRLADTDWIGAYKIGCILRARGLGMTQAVALESRRARYILRGLLQKRASLLAIETMKLKIDKKLWGIESHNSFYVPKYRGMARRTWRYQEAAVCLSVEEVSYWPILIDGRHLPFALMDEIGGAKGLAYAAGDQLLQLAILAMEHPWRLFYSPEIETGTIIDLADLDDDEYQTMLDELDAEVPDDSALFDMLDRPRRHEPHRAGSASWLETPTASSLK